MRKGNGKKTLRAVLAAALGTVMLMSLAWAGVTDVTGGSKTIVNTTVENVYTDTEQFETLALTKGTNTFEGMGSYMGNGEREQAEGTMTVQFAGLSTPVNIVYTVAGDAVTMTVVNYGELPQGNYTSGEVETRMTTTYTGSKLDYTGTDYEDGTSSGTGSSGKVIINETRTDYYNRHHYKLTLTLTVSEDAKKVVGAFYLNDVTLTFQAGEAPRFTATLPAGAPYTLARQSWFEDKEGGKGVTTDPNYTEYVGKELTAFAEGQRYSYLAKFTLQEGYTLANDCKFFLNGQEVFIRTESGSQDAPFVRLFGANDDEPYFFAHMTPERQQQEQVSSGRSYGGPYITALLTAPDAKSATDYSGGIYGLTFKSSAGFPSFLGVQVDGKTIDKSCYIAEEGSIEVYLKAVYLRTLAAGKHTVTILSSQGNTTAEFTIGGLNTAPKTFDAGVAVYGVTAVLSLGGMAWMGKKKAH